MNMSTIYVLHEIFFTIDQNKRIGGGKINLKESQPLSPPNKSCRKCSDDSVYLSKPNSA